MVCYCLVFPADNVLVFCDPPYRGVFDYGSGFGDVEHCLLVERALEWSVGGVSVFISGVDLGDGFYEGLLPCSEFWYFDFKHTVGRRGGFGDGVVREFLVRVWWLVCGLYFFVVGSVGVVFTVCMLCVMMVLLVWVVWCDFVV